MHSNVDRLYTGFMYSIPDPSWEGVSWEEEEGEEEEEVEEVCLRPS